MEAMMPPHTRPNTNDFFNFWQNRIYDYIYGDYKKLIDQLPDWAKVKTDWISVFVGEVLLRFPLGKDEYALEDSNGDWNKSFIPICKLDEHDPLALDFKASKQQIIDWDTKRMALKKELQKVVNACNTSSQLYQAWPKALEFAHLFPYKGTKTTPKPKISSSALDLTLKITKSVIDSPQEN